MYGYLFRRLLGTIPVMLVVAIGMSEKCPQAEVVSASKIP
jgi:hypothetical protein